VGRIAGAISVGRWSAGYTSVYSEAALWVQGFVGIFVRVFLMTIGFNVGLGERAVYIHPESVLDR